MSGTSSSRHPFFRQLAGPEMLMAAKTLPSGPKTGATDAFFLLLEVDCLAILADLLELGLELGGVGYRAHGMLGQTRTGDEIYETRRLVGQKEDFAVDFSYEGPSEGPEVGRLLRQERFDDVPKFVRNKWFR